MSMKIHTKIHKSKEQKRHLISKPAYSDLNSSFNKLSSNQSADKLQHNNNSYQIQSKQVRIISKKLQSKYLQYLKQNINNFPQFLKQLVQSYNIDIDGQYNQIFPFLTGIKVPKFQQFSSKLQEMRLFSERQNFEIKKIFASKNLNCNLPTLQQNICEGQQKQASLTSQNPVCYNPNFNQNQPQYIQNSLQFNANVNTQQISSFNQQMTEKNYCPEVVQNIELFQRKMPGQNLLYPQQQQISQPCAQQQQQIVSQPVMQNNCQQQQRINADLNTMTSITTQKNNSFNNNFDNQNYYNSLCQQQSQLEIDSATTQRSNSPQLSWQQTSHKQSFETNNKEFYDDAVTDTMSPCEINNKKQQENLKEFIKFDSISAQKFMPQYSLKQNPINYNLLLDTMNQPLMDADPYNANSSSLDQLDQQQLQLFEQGKQHNYYNNNDQSHEIWNFNIPAAPYEKPKQLKADFFEDDAFNNQNNCGYNNNFAIDPCYQQDNYYVPSFL